MKDQKSISHYFRVLGLSQGAGDGEIRERYVALVKEHPPDRDPEGFKEIQNAYERLKDLPARLEALLFEYDHTPDSQAFQRELMTDGMRQPIPLLEILRKCRKI